MKGDLEEEVTKGGKSFVRRLNPDRTYPAPDGSTLELVCRSLMLVRNVGHLMTNPAILDADGNMLLDVRGWGHLTATGALHLDPEEAMVIQDRIGARVAEAMNDACPPEGKRAEEECEDFVVGGAPDYFYYRLKYDVPELFTSKDLKPGIAFDCLWGAYSRMTYERTDGLEWEDGDTVGLDCLTHYELLAFGIAVDFSWLYKVLLVDMANHPERALEDDGGIGEATDTLIMVLKGRVSELVERTTLS